MQLYEDYMYCQVQPGSAFVRSRWLRHVRSEKYRAGMLHVCGLIRKHRTTRWLYDASKLALDLRDQTWTVEVLGAMLTDTSLRRIAVVMPVDVLLQAVAEGICDKSKTVFNGGIEIEAFYDVNSAEEWLLEGS